MTLLTLKMTPYNSQMRIMLTPYIIRLWETLYHLCTSN